MVICNVKEKLKQTANYILLRETIVLCVTNLIYLHDKDGEMVHRYQQPNVSCCRYLEMSNFVVNRLNFLSLCTLSSTVTVALLPFESRPLPVWEILDPPLQR